MPWRLWLAAAGLAGIAAGMAVAQRLLGPAAARKCLHILIGPGYLVCIAGSSLVEGGAWRGIITAIPATLGLAYRLAVSPALSRRFGKSGGRRSEGRQGIWDYGVAFSLTGALVLGVGSGGARSRGLEWAYQIAVRSAVAGGLCLAGGDGLAGLAALLPERLRLRLYGRKTLAGAAFCVFGSGLFMAALYDWCAQGAGGAAVLGRSGGRWSVDPRVPALAYICAVVEGLPFWGFRDNVAVYLTCGLTWGLWEALCSPLVSGVAGVPLQSPAACAGFWACFWSVVALAAFTWHAGKFTPAAALLGFALSVLHLATSWAGFCTMMLFVIVGITATRVGRAAKSRLVADGEYDGSAGKTGAGVENGRPQEQGARVHRGRRAAQVLATSATQGALCLAARLSPDHETRRKLESAAVVGYAVSLADTLGSEIGMAVPGAVFTLYPWGRVRPGTNGGLSLAGTLASALGGAAVGLVHCLCLAGLSGTGEDLGPRRFARVLVDDTVFAVLGMLLDSVMGSNFQFSGVDARGRVTTDEKGAVEVIFSKNALSNTAINFLSTALTCSAYLAVESIRSGSFPGAFH